MEILLSNQAEKALDKIQSKQQDKIIEAMQGLLFEPPRGDIKKLRGKINEYRLRVGNYRVIFSYISENISILDIGVRGGIYK